MKNNRVLLGMSGGVDSSVAAAILKRNGYDVVGIVGDDKINAVVTGSITFPSESPVTNVLESYTFTA